MASAALSCPLGSGWKIQEGFTPMYGVWVTLQTAPLSACKGSDDGHFGKSLPYYSMAHTLQMYAFSTSTYWAASRGQGMATCPKPQTESLSP